MEPPSADARQTDISGVSSMLCGFLQAKLVSFLTLYGSLGLGYDRKIMMIHQQLYPTIAYFINLG